MNLVDESLRFFVQHLQPRAIVLKGDWGVGKTFYWRNVVVKEFLANSNTRAVNRGYAYVSLFGLESIQQVKDALAFSYVENERPGAPRLLVQAVKRFVRWAIGFFSRATGDDLAISAGVVTVNAQSLMNNFAFLSIRGALVCIDDLERRNQNLLLGDVLGLVSYLVDQRMCRVVLILNYDTLSDSEKEEWARNQDKVFENELLYRPTHAQSIEVGLQGTEHESWHGVVRDVLLRLEINNVRVVARTQRFVRQVLGELTQAPKLRDIPPQTRLEVAKVAAILAAVNASRGAGAPSVQELVNSSYQLSYESTNEAEERSSEEKEWIERIKRLGIHLGDSLDKAIATSVIDGYPRMDLISDALLSWEEGQQQRARDDRFQQAWNAYHNSLGDDADAVYAAFRDAWPGVVATESVRNIESTGRLLRLLGHPEAATDLFRQWIAARAGERSNELLEDSFFPGVVVSDEEFRALLEAATKDLPARHIPLMDSLLEMDSGSWSDEAINSIANSSPEEIREALGAQARDWRRCFRTLSTYSLHERTGKLARRNFLGALKLISDSSTLNADRVKNRLGKFDLEAAIAAVNAELGVDDEVPHVNIAP